jgi:putative ABC transport system permease protein
MIFSVVIYFTFVSLQYSPEIAKSIDSWDMMRSIFVQASILLILFVTVFILYSNSFFTKKRKKEIGLYSLMGLRKKTIGKMLFYENLIMGAIAIIIGILLGSLLSKLFSMILLRLLNSAVTVRFHISIEAIINTVIVFAIIILFTSIQAYRLIYRFKLIELFQAEKEGELAPQASKLSAGLAVGFLSFSYWIVFHPITVNPTTQLLLFLMTIVIGTYLLFRFLIIFLLKSFQNNTSRYYKGINYIGTSQLLYRIKGNARTLTMIALLSAVTLCAISVGYGSYYNVEESTKNFSPFSYMHLSKKDTVDQQVRSIILEDQVHSVTAELDIPVIQVSGDLTDMEYIPYGYSAEDVPVHLLSVSTFNQIQKVLDRNEYLELSGDQAAAIRPWQDNTSSDYRGHEVIFQLPNEKMTATYKKMVEDRIVNWSSPDFNVVISDSMFADIAKQVKPTIYKAYKVENEKTTKETTNKLMKFVEKDLELSSFYTAYQTELQSSGVDIFLLGFLGLVFLTATGSIIYFKQLTEAHADKSRYEILRKIGVSKREILITVAKQTLFVFAWPLVIGILHCVTILKAIFGVNLTDGNILVPILIAISAYIVIYLVYYVSTVKTYFDIVSK